MPEETFTEIIPAASLGDLLNVYHQSVAKLNAYRTATFRHRQFVKVDCDRFRGYGIVLLSSEPPPHLLAVLLENGNTWWYPVDTVEPVSKVGQVPRSVRRMKLRWHGYKLGAAA